MKKVLLSAYACSPDKGSEEGNGWSWAVNLAEKGFEVWCLTNTQDKDAAMAAMEKLRLPGLHIIFVKVPYGLDTFLLDSASKKIYFHYYLWTRKAAAIAMELHKKIKFDVAHHVTYGSLQQGSFLWKLKDTRFVFGPVGGGQAAPEAFKEYFGKGWQTERIRSFISDYTLRFSATLKHTLQRADSILATNTDTVALIKKTKYYQPEKVHLVIDNAVPPSMENTVYSEKVPGKTLKILWVGRMFPRKGLKLLFHALSLVPEHIDYSFTIVGGGSQFPQLQDWIKEYAINPDRLHITGQIPFPEVLRYYRESDLFMFCSLRDSCPAQLNEAMAFGLPVITLDLHGSALAVPDNCGLKITPVTKDQTALDISRAVVRFSEDREFLKTCSLHAFNYAKTNTWTRKIEKITETYY